MIIMELSRCFLTRSSSRLRQKDVNEDEPEDTDAAVHEEGREGAEVVLERLEGLGDDEPGKVGGEGGQGVGPGPGPHRQNLRGYHPGQGTDACN